MRKTVYMIDGSEHYNKNWYVFKGISVFDIYYFFKKSIKTYPFILIFQMMMKATLNFRP
ncbi:MAG: hypothetical protein RBQ97_10600 [Acholeplasma sp.]|jgi:hypothetical protein|nr:hypothetical protein [Acholeplasma sp.]